MITINNKVMEESPNESQKSIESRVMAIQAQIEGLEMQLASADPSRQLSLRAQIEGLKTEFTNLREKLT